MDPNNTYNHYGMQVSPVDQSDGHQAMPAQTNTAQPAQPAQAGQPGTAPGQMPANTGTMPAQPGGAPGTELPNYGQAQQAGQNATGTMTGSTTGAMPAAGTMTGMPATDTTTATMTGTDTTVLALQHPTVMGIPVDSIMVFTPLFLAGVLVYAWMSGRTPHTEQLTRLDKQRKRFEAREAAKPESIDIFKQEKDNMLGRVLSQAGLEAQYEVMKVRWISSAIGTTVGMFGLCAWQAPPLAPFAIIAGPALGSFAFFQYLRFQALQRQKRLTAQLPQVLETMVSTLKAGSPVVECFKLLSETAPDPIKQEFRRALVSMQLGKPFRDVLAEMGTRIRTADFRLLTQAIFISQDVGANLADVVATIAEAIRERFRLRDFLNSLTAQGKMTALFIGCLPYFITAMTYMMAPGYIIPFLNHPIARIIFIAMMIWEAIGAWILVKMTTFEV